MCTSSFYQFVIRHYWKNQCKFKCYRRNRLKHLARNDVETEILSMPMSSYQKHYQKVAQQRVKTARIQGPTVCPFISYSSYVFPEHTHYGSTSSHPSCHLHCAFCSVYVWQAFRWTTTADKEPLNEQTRNGKRNV